MVFAEEVPPLDKKMWHILVDKPSKSDLFSHKHLRFDF